VAAILSLNGAKNNPKIVTKITAVRPKGGALAQGPPPLNTLLVKVTENLIDWSLDDVQPFQKISQRLDQLF